MLLVGSGADGQARGQEGCRCRRSLLPREQVVIYLGAGAPGALVSQAITSVDEKVKVSADKGHPRRTFIC